MFFREDLIYKENFLREFFLSDKVKHYFSR